MRDIRLKTMGEIVLGEERGRFVEVLDDLRVSGGLLILIYDNLDRSGDAHDHWVESIVDVELLFAELGWDIAWCEDRTIEGEAS